MAESVDSAQVVLNRHQVVQRGLFFQNIMQEKQMFATGTGLEVVNTSDDKRSEIVIMVENYSHSPLL